MSGAPTISPIRGALGSVGEHIVAPLLVLLSDCIIMFGVGRAHHVELLVLHLVVTVATPLVHVGLVFDPSSLEQHRRTGRAEEGTEAQRGRRGDWRWRDWRLMASNGRSPPAPDTQLTRKLQPGRLRRENWQDWFEHEVSQHD